MNILFRADSSSFIGAGHIMRDLVLAQNYKNKNIIFATQDLQGNINHKITELNFKLEILRTNTIEELDSLIKKLHIDLMIIDHYAIDYKFEKELKTKNPALKLMVLDDTYEQHYCDILLNHNISAKATRYKNLVPKNCEIKCGSKFTLIREEFVKEKRKKHPFKNSKEKNIFLAMGGTDPYNYNIKILKALKNIKNLTINVVTTTSNIHIKQLKKYCYLNKNVKLHINTTKMAQLINTCNLAIVTPSVTVQEVLFMEKPFIAIKISDNQTDIYNYLKKNRYICCNHINKFIQLPKRKLKHILNN